MNNKIILSADSACDLGIELKGKYNVNYYPFHIILGENQYMDGEDIYPDDIYKEYWENKILPKTAAIGVGEYINYFKNWVDNGYEVIHINLGSGISSAYQNCCVAAQELGYVYPVDSTTLSVGIGQLVIKAYDMIQQGISAQEIQKRLIELSSKSKISFVLNTLEFLHAGGRCSSIAAMGANLLRLKPCIEVDNAGKGKMSVTKKYRGDLDKVLTQYANDRLSNIENIDTDKIFIVHSGIDQKYIDIVKKIVDGTKKFNEVYVLRASCTISAHCGPNTLGLVYMEK